MLIPLGLIVAAAGLLALVVLGIRVAPRLRDMHPAKKRRRTREELVVERILTERLTRRLRAFGTDIGGRVRRASSGIQPRLERGYRKLRLLAQEHAHPVALTPATCDVLIPRAEAALASGDWDAAEEQYLGCLKVDAKHRGAYLGLATLYRQRKEDTLAEETLKFLRKLYPDDAEVAYGLADVLHTRGKCDAALKEIRAALRAAPKNPRYLDFALECAMVKQDAPAAREYLAMLRDANPENAKLEELEERVRMIAK